LCNLPTKSRLIWADYRTKALALTVALLTVTATPKPVILWPILLASFVLLIIDRAGHRRKDMPVSPEMSQAERRALRVRRQTPHSRVSRWVARRIIARQEHKGI
jgi:hypothetical protein